jgi:predicted DNA-binding protein
MTEHPTSIRLSTELKRALKREAQARRWGVAELIQEILKGWLSKQK